jgi:Na+/H+ antiporter NhaD/arsenite permease-like protein
MLTPAIIPLTILLGAAGHTEVSTSVTFLFAALLVGLIVCLALEEKLHAKKSLIAGVFAVVCLLLGTAVGLPLPFEPIAIGGHFVHLPVYIPAVDWGVIAIILGSGVFVDVTSRSGLFTWIAIKLTKASKGDPVKLLWAYGLMTVVFSAVLNNVTAMIIVGSLSAVSLNKLRRNDKLLAFLLIEGLLTNIGGLLTLISSVPNIIVGTAAKISFMAFFVKSVPYVILATVLTLFMGTRLFGIKKLTSTAAKEEAASLIQGFDENAGIESRGFFWFATVMTLLFVVVIATTSILPGIKDLGMGYVALGFAVIMLIRYKSEVDTFYRAVDWDLLGFFAALFIVINVMEYAAVLGLIGNGLKWVIDLGETLGTGALLVAAAVFSSVTDNIPLAAMLAKIIAGLPTASGAIRPPTDPLWWSVVFGANLGGNLTPIGSASTLVAVTIMHKHKLPMNFATFVLKAFPFAVAQIVLATAYVLLVIA